MEVAPSLEVTPAKSPARGRRHRYRLRKEAKASTEWPPPAPTGTSGPGAGEPQGTKTRTAVERLRGRLTHCLPVTMVTTGRLTTLLGALACVRCAGPAAAGVRRRGGRRTRYRPGCPSARRLRGTAHLTAVTSCAPPGEASSKRQP